MNRFAKFLSLIFAIAMLVSLVSCTREPTITVDEALQKGQTMLFAADETPRDFTLDIVKDKNYEYIFTGHSCGTQALISLQIIHNGLISNYKNLLLIQGDNMYLNLNNALTISEVEADFIFSETLDLQGKYLEIKSGASTIHDLTQHMQQVFVDTIPHTNATFVRGTNTYKTVYTHDSSKDIMAEIATSTLQNKSHIVEALSDCINSNIGNAFDTYKTAFAYLNDCIDIDTEELTGDYVLLDEYITSAIISETQAYANLMALDGYYMSEEFAFNAITLPKFEYSLKFYDNKNVMFSSIYFAMTEAEKIDDSLAQLSKESHSLITSEAFMDVLLTNAKNAKGVGYETNDFPYSLTYTNDQLTATETNDLYRAAYVFRFSGRRITSYTVEFFTYETYIHNALAQKYDSLGYEMLDDDTSALITGTGSGYLKFTTDIISPRYSEANSTIELFDIIQEIGLPSYE